MSGKYRYPSDPISLTGEGSFEQMQKDWKEHEDHKLLVIENINGQRPRIRQMLESNRSAIQTTGILLAHAVDFLER